VEIDEGEDAVFVDLKLEFTEHNDGYDTDSDVGTLVGDDDEDMGLAQRDANDLVHVALAAASQVLEESGLWLQPPCPDAEGMELKPFTLEESSSRSRPAMLTLQDEFEGVEVNMGSIMLQEATPAQELLETRFEPASPCNSAISTAATENMPVVENATEKDPQESTPGAASSHNTTAVTVTGSSSSSLQVEQMCLNNTDTGDKDVEPPRMMGVVQQQLLKAPEVSPSAISMPTTPRREPPLRCTKRRVIGAVVCARPGSKIEATRPPSQPVVKPPEGMPSARGSAFSAARNLQLYRLDLEDNASSAGIATPRGKSKGQLRESSLAGTYDMLGVEFHRMDDGEPECTTPRAMCTEQSRCTTSRTRKQASNKAQQRRSSSHRATTRGAAKHISALEEDLGADACSNSSWVCPLPPPNPSPVSPSLSRSSSCKSRPSTTTKVISAALSTSRPHSLAMPRTVEFKQQVNLQYFSARSGNHQDWQQMITPLPPRSARPSKSSEWDAIRAKPWSFEQGLAMGRVSTWS